MAKWGSGLKIKLHMDANGTFLSRLKMKLKLVFFSNPFQMFFSKADISEDKVRSEDFIHISVRLAVPH